MKPVKTVPFVLIAFALTACITTTEQSLDRNELEIDCVSRQINGTFVMFDPLTEIFHVSNTQRAQQRFIPASTFKIVNTLIGLETGTVKSVDEVLPYGGKPQLFKQWEHDMPLREAIKLSAIPIYQELARRIGVEQMSAGVKDLGYGNTEIGSVIDRFWLDGPLTISAIEQTQFLGKLTQGQLPGGLKLVQGGGSGFLGTQFSSVRASLLYADTVLVPDPVMPWFEAAREEERFRHVKLLQAIFAVLHLKPLIDADLPVPPVFVFPSMEKLLDENDEHTQVAAMQLTADVIAHYVDPGITSIEEVFEVIRSAPEEFLARVDANSLFVAPGGAIGEPLADALNRYDSELATWRTAEWLENYRKMPVTARVMNGIFERLTPQYHLLENSEELNAHPLLSIDQQAHYFRLVSETNSARLTHLGLLDSRREALVNGMGQKRLLWLNGVPIEALVELRRNNENARFRDRLLGAVRNMHESQIQDADRVAAEISLEIATLVGEHEREIQSIQERYLRSHGQTAVGAWAAVGATLMPSLAPFLGAAAPFAIAAKYAWDKIAELRDHRVQARSLMGVLAQANAQRNGSA